MILCRNIWFCMEVHFFENRRKKQRCFSNLMFVCSSVRMEQLEYTVSNFVEYKYLSIFWKSFDEIQYRLISDRNNRYLTWRHVHLWWGVDNFFNVYIFITWCCVLHHFNRCLHLFTCILHECDFITGQISKSGTGTPHKEYNAWWSQETLSVYRLDDKKLFVVRPL